MAFRVCNGGIDGEIRIGKGWGMKLQFRGRIYDQKIAEWTAIRGFEHDMWSKSPCLGNVSLWGTVDAFLNADGILIHRYPKHEYLLVGTLCRYGRMMAYEEFGRKARFFRMLYDARFFDMKKITSKWICKSPL